MGNPEQNSGARTAQDIGSCHTLPNINIVMLFLEGFFEVELDSVEFSRMSESMMSSAPSSSQCCVVWSSSLIILL